MFLVSFCIKVITLSGFQCTIKLLFKTDLAVTTAPAEAELPISLSAAGSEMVCRVIGCSSSFDDVGGFVGDDVGVTDFVGDVGKEGRLVRSSSSSGKGLKLNNIYLRIYRT
jgi:hypothetical protein